MHTTVKSNFFFKVAFSFGVFLMYNMEMGFCHHVMCMGVHVLFRSRILAFTGSKRFKGNYSLRSVCATLCVPALGGVGRGVDIFKENWC